MNIGPGGRRLLRGALLNSRQNSHSRDWPEEVLSQERGTVQGTTRLPTPVILAQDQVDFSGLDFTLQYNFKLSLIPKNSSHLPAHA